MVQSTWAAVVATVKGRLTYGDESRVDQAGSAVIYEESNEWLLIVSVIRDRALAWYSIDSGPVSTCYGMRSG